MLKIRNGRDFVGGAAMIVVSLLFIAFGRELDVGNSFQMGPGYFPVMLSLLLIGIGVLIIVQSLVVAVRDEPDAPANWKASILVILAPVFFGLALSRLGLAPTMFLMVGGVSCASRYAGWRHSIALALFMAISSVVLFTRLLSLPVSAFGPWIPFLSN
ncbi:tripartite tricarboxylate transporter TctB family protein [Rhizobium bangladeshense]|uniref:Tripartite tricarboxylate transporter TctB family protein n=1 Tax=Rhizobium bangladeshense TaxID=1138189 RepID=A0ABS7LHR8_9HYPH|nr:tripartite tricarboxylate transporter TctB family protein [Rhizobium bangladeshense]MBX4867390.1 tripartite tricarboxylate transporter TctB family protein [Rhizobium bangladeshense]MBX4871682.1 tripartite tricarboxylate transporter TctB family protein [Rhizobium bangladeshense]MBX4882996.1 tripartite tricarboxylate transporter TctB family protein [Rhizobium bangladeshense]MBX4891381.1 tripartite tricarboxylate transporter TctB family protein [Rhizobium bangladeshense]MBX4934373.1 tripartite